MSYCRFCFETDGHLDKCDRPQPPGLLGWTAIVGMALCLAVILASILIPLWPALFHG